VLTQKALRDALVVRGLAHAAQFSWKRTASRLMDVYRDVASRAA
jgi:hypothetical protein